MRRRVTNWLIASPQSPVSKGKTWKREQASRYEDIFLCVNFFMLGENVFWDGQTLTKIDVRSEMKQPNSNTGKQEAKILEQNGEGVGYFDDRTGRVVDAGYHV